MRGVGICVIKCHGGGGEGVKKWSNLCYVINEWPLSLFYSWKAPVRLDSLTPDKTYESQP